MKAKAGSLHGNRELKCRKRRDATLINMYSTVFSFQFPGLFVVACFASSHWKLGMKILNTAMILYYTILSFR